MDDSSDKEFYDASPEAISLPALKEHCRIVRKYVARYDSRLIDFAGTRSLRILELGAGSCVTSLMLSNIRAVREVVCLDISIKKMREMLPLSVRAVDVCDPEKIRMIEGHFDARLPFEDHEFDVVVFDGALHHARSMWFVLAECIRVLRPEGVLIAQREQYLGMLTAAYKLSRLLQTPEVMAGVSENAYLRAQYEYYLRAAGFGSVLFWPVAESLLQRVLGFLNGIIFSKWVIWAQSAAKA